MTKLEGKICVVTGAASGMGRSIAIQLATKEKITGLAICDVNEKELLHTAKLASVSGVRVLSTIVDVSNREQVKRWKDEIVNEFGGCDVLFNNAGINAIGKLVYGPNDDPQLYEKNWDRCFNIDFYGVLYCCREFLPVLISRKEAHIINTSSVNAFYTWPEHSCYTAAKHAVKGLTDSLMVELKVKAPHVKVTLLHPGGVKTGIANATIHGHTNNPKTTRIAEVFEFVADLTSDQAGEWIIGAVKQNKYRVLVGYDAWLFDKMLRFFPTKAYDFYEQVGREGLNVDAFDPNHNNDKIIGPLVVARIFVSGLWLPLLFLSPMPLLKLRHYSLGRLALYTMGASVGYAGFNALTGPASKL